MADKKPVNLPDILGHITSGARVNIGLVQVALAIRPRVLRAGRPFETVLMVQNASDVPVDFVARVRLPGRDAKGKKGRFVTKVEKLVIGLEPAQVGYIVLPVSTLPDTAISADYAITMDVQMKAVSDDKPRRVRDTDGGGDVKLDNLSDDITQAIDDLSRLNWTADKVSGLRSTGLEVKFGLMSGTVGKIADLKPGWESLWTMADLSDESLLLPKFRKPILDHVVPNLLLDKIYSRAYQVTLANFEAAGFKLSKWEAIVIAKMLSLILILAVPTKLMELIAGDYNIVPLLAEDANLDGAKIPRWLNQFLELVNREPRAFKQPVKSIFHFCFEGLLQDAIMHSFERVELALNESLGDTQERELYQAQFMEKYRDHSLGFSDTYLPLMLGGITAVDLVVLPDDNMEDAVRDLQDMVNRRRNELLNDETAGLFDMIDGLMEKVLLKYGYDAKRM